MSETSDPVMEQSELRRIVAQVKLCMMLDRRDFQHTACYWRKTERGTWDVKLNDDGLTLKQLRKKFGEDNIYPAPTTVEVFIEAKAKRIHKVKN